MPETTVEQRLSALSGILESGTMQQARRMLNNLHPAEIADLLESLPPAERKLAWELVDSELDGEVLVEVSEEVRSSLIRDMDHAELLAATEGLAEDDLTDLLQSLPRAVINEALQAMDRQNRHRLETLLSYPEDSAGGLMSTDIITIRADVTVDVVLRYLRMRGEIPAQTDSLIVVNRFDEYLGMVPLTILLTADPDLSIADYMDRSIEPVNVYMKDTAVARLFQDRDLISAAVVNDDHRVLGRVTIDDVVDVIREDAEHTVMSMSGLAEEEDIFAPVLPSARRRAIWLGVNLLTAFLAAWVIGLFEATIDQIVALAVLMPIVASMGGIAGSQTLTLVIRGLALGQVGSSNVRWLLNKEISVGLLNGFTWALVVAITAGLWFQDTWIAGIIAAALIINLLAGAVAGVSIPLILRRMNIDPALAGSVILTTVTDVMGFFSFLGLATLLLL